MVWSLARGVEQGGMKNEMRAPMAIAVGARCVLGFKAGKPKERACDRDGLAKETQELLLETGGGKGKGR